MSLLGGLYETGLLWGLVGPLDPVIGGAPRTPRRRRPRPRVRIPPEGARPAAPPRPRDHAVRCGRAASLTAFLTPRQIVTYALVATLYVPCIASVTALAREIGSRQAALVSGITILWALAVGATAARLPR